MYGETLTALDPRRAAHAEAAGGADPSGTEPGRLLPKRPLDSADPAVLALGFRCLRAWRRAAGPGWSVRARLRRVVEGLETKAARDETALVAGLIDLRLTILDLGRDAPWCITALCMDIGDELERASANGAAFETVRAILLGDRNDSSPRAEGMAPLIPVLRRLARYPHRVRDLATGALTRLLPCLPVGILNGGPSPRLSGLLDAADPLRPDAAIFNWIRSRPNRIDGCILVPTFAASEREDAWEGLPVDEGPDRSEITAGAGALAGCLAWYDAVRLNPDHSVEEREKRLLRIVGMELPVTGAMGCALIPLAPFATIRARLRAHLGSRIELLRWPRPDGFPAVALLCLGAATGCGTIGVESVAHVSPDVMLSELPETVQGPPNGYLTYKLPDDVLGEQGESGGSEALLTETVLPMAGPRPDVRMSASPEGPNVLSAEEFPGGSE